MSDMFGGMSTAGGARRKRAPTQAVATKNDETASNNSSHPETVHDKQAEEQLRRDNELRERLSKFYTYYNPSKVEGIEKTVEMFRGNEPKLFEMLNTKYGPEPTVEMYDKFCGERDAKEAAKNAKSNDGKTHLKRRAQASAQETTASTNNNSSKLSDPNESFVTNPAGWGDNNNNNAATTTATATGGFGFGAQDTSQENLASSGWGETDNGAAGGAGGFGFSDGTSVGGGDGGFGFGGGAANNTGGGGFGFGGGGETSTVSGNETGGFGFGDATSTNANGGGFGFGGGAETTTTTTTEETTTTTGGGFGFGFEANNTVATTEEVKPSGFGGFSFGDVATAEQHQQQGKKISSSSDDDDDSSDADAAELMDRRLNQRLGSLVEKRDVLAQVITTLTVAVSDRRKTLQLCQELEAKVDELTQKEQFDEAEETDNQLSLAAKKIGEFDRQWLSNTALLNGIADDIKSGIADSSRSFAEERANLTQIRAEEERKMNSYVTDATHKVESTAARIKVDLDKAVRAQTHVEQDLEELQKRKSEIEAKIAEQTKGLRAEKEKVSADADRLEDEIRDLEKLLASKKRQLSDKTAQLDDLNHKLELITKNHQEVIDGVLESMAEEETHLRVCRSRVEDISEQKRQNEEENASLQEERRVMQRDLDQHNAKITLLERQSQSLATDVSIGFSGYFKKVIRAMSEVRGGEGKFCLMVPYVVAGSNDEESSPSAAADASSQLQNLKATVNKLGKQLTLKSDEIATLLSRLQEIQRAIPAIETAKKQAAAAKQFKEAQAKTSELKTLSDEKDQINEHMEALAADMASLKKELDAATVLKDAEAKKFRSSMRSFMDKYSSVLRNASDSMEAADDLSCLCVDGVLNLDSSSSSSATNNALRSASSQLLNALFSELAAVCEVPEAELRKGASSSSSSPASQSNLSSPVSKKEEPAPIDAVAAVAEEVEEKQVEEFNDNNEEVQAEEEEQQQEFPVVNKEDLEAKLEKLTADLADAENAEDYGLCDELQTQIDALNEELSKL